MAIHNMTRLWYCMYLASIMVNVCTMTQAAHGYFMKKGQIMPEAKCSNALLEETATVSHAASNAVLSFGAVTASKRCHCIACPTHTALAPRSTVMCLSCRSVLSGHIRCWIDLYCSRVCRNGLL